MTPNDPHAIPDHSDKQWAVKPRPRTERRTLEMHQRFTAEDCVMLWQMGIRADEDTYRLPEAQ